MSKNKDEQTVQTCVECGEAIDGRLVMYHGNPYHIDGKHCLEAVKTRASKSEAALAGLGDMASEFGLRNGAEVIEAIVDGRILMVARKGVLTKMATMAALERDNEAMHKIVAELDRIAAILEMPDAAAVIEALLDERLVLSFRRDAMGKIVAAKEMIEDLRSQNVTLRAYILELVSGREDEAKNKRGTRVRARAKGGSNQWNRRSRVISDEHQ